MTDDPIFSPEYESGKEETRLSSEQVEDTDAESQIGKAKREAEGRLAQRIVSRGKPMRIKLKWWDLVVIPVAILIALRLAADLVAELF